MAIPARKRPVLESCGIGGPRVHLRRVASPERALCGNVVRGAQPPRDAPATCVTCARKGRELVAFRAPDGLAPAMAGRGEKVHLTRAPKFLIAPAAPTLCGLTVKALLATGPAAVDCEKCRALAKQSA